MNYFYPVGVSIVTILVTDESGNQTECTYEVEVFDDEAPVFVNCPTDTIQSSSNFTDCDGRWHVEHPICQDNCEVEVEQVSGPDQILPVGGYRIYGYNDDGVAATW